MFRFEHNVKLKTYSKKFFQNTHGFSKNEIDYNVNVKLNTSSHFSFVSH